MTILYVFLYVLFLTDLEKSVHSGPDRRCLHMSRIPRHSDLHPGRNIYLTRPPPWFILSVLFLTGGKTFVVPTHVQDPPSQGLYPGRNV